MRAENYSPASLRTIQSIFNINQGDLLPIPIGQSETRASTPTISKVVTWLFSGKIQILGENPTGKSSNTSDIAH